MKMLFALLFLVSVSANAQAPKDPKTYIEGFDSKIYTLKNKGVKEFVVDVESSRLRDRLNEQGVFGKVDKLTFRVFWTAQPERLAIEVLGLPDGFREVKEELKASLLSGMDLLLPIGVMDKFKGHKITAGPAPKEFIAQDTSGAAQIPSYVLKFDSRDTLVEVIGRKHVGTFNVKTNWDKESFSDGKWVIKEQVTTSEDNGQTTVSTKELDYTDVKGVGVLEEVSITVVQKFANPELKSIKVEEELEFKNWKIDSGEALKYFLGDQAKK